MKKPITDEKFYITDIPKDKQKLRELISFLGDSHNWINWQYDMWVTSPYNFMFYYDDGNEYTFYTGKVDNFEEHNNLIKIDYKDLLCNYLPKDTALNDAVDEALKEVTKNEDKPNKYKK